MKRNSDPPLDIEGIVEIWTPNTVFLHAYAIYINFCYLYFGVTLQGWYEAIIRLDVMVGTDYEC